MPPGHRRHAPTPSVLAPACTTVSAGRALRDNLHAWRPTAAGGWFVCAGCGIAGVCRGCFEALDYEVPLARPSMRCDIHRAECPDGR